MKKSNIFLILAVVCILVLIVFLTLSSDKKISVESDEVKDLYKYLGEADINHCGGLINYRDEETTIDDLEDENRLCMAYYQLEKDKIKEETIKSTGKNKSDIKVCKIGEKATVTVDNDSNECVVSSVDKNALNEAYKKIYGIDIKEDKSFYITTNKACYKEGEKYYCGSAETYSVSLAPDSTIYRLINKAIKKLNGDIIIYDYYLKISDNKCYPKGNTVESTTCSKKIADEKIDLSDEKAITNLVKEYGTVYKHTFKKDSNDVLHWYKSEID